MENDEIQEAIREIITRMFIPYGQMTLYRALFIADDWVSKPLLAAQIRETDEVSLTGVLGALGKRVNETNTIDEQFRIASALFVDRRRVLRILQYRMRAELRNAIESLPQLRELLLTSNIQQIGERYRNSWWQDESAQKQDLGL